MFAHQILAQFGSRFVAQDVWYGDRTVLQHDAGGVVSRTVGSQQKIRGRRGRNIVGAAESIVIGKFVIVILVKQIVVLVLVIHGNALVGLGNGKDVGYVRVLYQ